MKKAISGIQPSNRLTLGNYLGAIKQFVELQDKYEMYIFIADLHAISVPFDPKTLIQNKINLVASYAAAGLDFHKTTIFYQSDVPAHAELGWILTCHTSMGELNRMTQFKDKTARVTLANKTESIPTGLLVYPVLMAADIMLYDADIVIVGSDQKQHVELTRDIALRMNKKYGKLFNITEPFIPKNGSRIMDLLDPKIKMSKSNTNEKGTIFLLDKPEEAVRKIMSAKTDSLNKVTFDYENQPGVTNLLTIYSCLSEKTINEIVKQYEGKNYGEFKKDLSEIVSSFLSNFQTKYNHVIKHFHIIESQLKINADKCIEITNDKLAKVYKAIGMTK